MNKTLNIFHPLIQQWFREQVGTPTDVQRQAWPEIAAGNHVLVSAPTGSGKTLTAFLWSVQQLLLSPEKKNATTVLYVSPLKALNNDIRRNLRTPLRQLEDVFKQANQPFPDIRVMVRSGDTPQSDRRKMLRQPPHILITTPESLNIMLSSHGGRSILGSLETVILDEIHGVVGSKRGTHLITAIDRLTVLSGEFQRIAISATVKPMETVAKFVAGCKLVDDDNGICYAPRPIKTIQSTTSKKYGLEVKFPTETTGLAPDASIWTPLTPYFRDIIEKNRSTVLFTNSRRLCESITDRINVGEEAPIAYAHHGSLSRPIRETVEQKLKEGSLKAIVATSSLEMGIDIGSLDEVVLVQAPPSISSAVQRLGRAGHQVGAESRGTLFPSHSRDILNAAVITKSVLEHDIEEIHPIECPLDILAQIIISMTAVQTWKIDDLYNQIRTSYPYRDLKRSAFDRVVNMLAGRYGDTDIRELKARISLDKIDGTITARRGSQRLLFLSGGSIPDRGYFNLRHHETGARIGELDEEFVWENAEGSVFSLGTQSWHVEKVTHNDVLVRPAPQGQPAPPFWKAEEFSRDHHLAMKIADFLEEANSELETREFEERLGTECHLNRAASDKLLDFLAEQKRTTKTSLPHRHHVLVEHVAKGPGGAPGCQIFLHIPWGGKLNRPLAMALQAAWKEQFGTKIEIYPSDDCIALVLEEDVNSATVLELVKSEEVIRLLRSHLESTGFFGARFRECAGRALLLSKSGFNQRTPLWMSRIRSAKLFDAVLRYDDFPMLLEAWRTTIEDEFDIPALQEMLRELEDGVISWTETFVGSPSPFARSMTWRQIDEYMYRDDSARGAAKSSLSDEALKEVLFSADLRPEIPAELVSEFQLKKHRLADGYSPRDSRELLDWLIERVAIPRSEFQALIEAIHRDHGIESTELLRELEAKAVAVQLDQLDDELIVARELLPRLKTTFYDDASSFASKSILTGEKIAEAPVTDGAQPAEGQEELFEALLMQWLRFYGPISKRYISESLGISALQLQFALEDLIDAQQVISGRLIKDDSQDLICDTENLEILMRMLRRASRSDFKARPLEELGLLLAELQGLTTENKGDDLPELLETLSGFSLDAGLWEGDVIAPRISNYTPSILDALVQQAPIKWIGTGKQQITICYTDDAELLFLETNISTEDAPGNGKDEHVDTWFPDHGARYSFTALLDRTNKTASQILPELWEAVWSGQIANDTFAALRNALNAGFKAPALKPPGQAAGRRRLRRRAAFGQFKSAVPFAGNWYRLTPPQFDEDPLESLERDKDRVRILLERYGVLFRELLLRELPALQWRQIFKTLRIMELSGEVIPGYFFMDVPGPQFISAEALRKLKKGLNKEAIYYLNAKDPASLSGLAVDSMKGKLPNRVATTHLVYRGSELVLVSKKSGKSVNIFVDPEDLNLPAYLDVFAHLLTRPVLKKRSLSIEEINSAPASTSPYLAAFQERFDVVNDAGRVKVYSKVR